MTPIDSMSVSGRRRGLESLEPGRRLLFELPGCAAHDHLVVDLGRASFTGLFGMSRPLQVLLNLALTSRTFPIVKTPCLGHAGGGSTRGTNPGFCKLPHARLDRHDWSGTGNRSGEGKFIEPLQVVHRRLDPNAGCPTMPTAHAKTGHPRSAEMPTPLSRPIHTAQKSAAPIGHAYGRVHTERRVGGQLHGRARKSRGRDRGQGRKAPDHRVVADDKRTERAIAKIARHAVRKRDAR